MSEETTVDTERSDAELTALAAAGDRTAEEALIVRYGQTVRKCARPLFLMGGDSEDLVQEGMLGLLYAVREYDPSRGASFRSYAETCIRNRLYSAVKAASREKHIPLNSYIPLDTAVLDGEEGADRGVAEQHQDDPEQLLIHREDEQERMNRIYSRLSPLESRILRLYLSGLSYSEIASMSHRSLKSVDNAVQRIRLKLARQSESGESSKADRIYKTPKRQNPSKKRG